MRNRFIAPAFAGTAFALTLGASAFHRTQPAVQTLSPASVAPAADDTPEPLPSLGVESQVVQPESLAEPASGSDAPEGAVADGLAQSAEGEVQAPAPIPPDSNALPSYEDDQAEQHAHGLQHARER